nr:hypothetical protein [Ferrimicrobium acidiphilum]
MIGAQRVWTAWGFVGANALPASLLYLGPDIYIEQVSEHCQAQLGRSGPRLVHPNTPWPDYFSALPAEVVVHSQWAIWIRTTASTFSDAWDEIERKKVPLVVAALAGFNHMPPRVELLRIGETAPDGTIIDPKSRWVGGTFGGFATRELSGSEADIVVARYHAARKHGTVASRIWHEATVLADKSDGSPRSMANIILTFFQVIEHIANYERPTGVDPAASDTRAAKKLVDKLAIDLNHDQLALTKKIGKIHAARDELFRIEERFLTQKIIAAKEVLGLDDPVVDSALAIAKLRNKALSHPGAELPETLAAWVEPAARTSAAFLTAHLDARTERAPLGGGLA